jgi:hypothetical protein
VQLRWDAPTSRVDNACLADLAAYRVSYGLIHKNYTESEEVAAEDLRCEDTGTVDPCGQVRSCDYTVENVGTGSWYFAVQAIDSSGNVSDYSEEAIITVQ